MIIKEDIKRLLHHLRPRLPKYRVIYLVWAQINCKSVESLESKTFL